MITKIFQIIIQIRKKNIKTEEPKPEEKKEETKIEEVKKEKIIIYQNIIEKKIGNDQFIIKEKKSQIKFDKDIRNFSLPMGMMTLNEAGENRKNNYISKYTMTKKLIL